VIATAAPLAFLWAFFSTILYSVLGIVLLLLTLVVANKIFRLNLHRELVDEHNTAFGVMIAGLAIAIGLIIAGTISS
jgi:putative membrane protein